jgi:glutaredoxin
MGEWVKISLARLWTWWRKPTRREPVRVFLYTRSGCHLCKVAWERLQEQKRRHVFQLEAVNIEGNPELEAQFGADVPVVIVNGRVRFRGKFNDVLFTRLLRAEENRPSNRESHK